MDYPTVTITDVSGVEELPSGKGVNLGNPTADAQVNNLLVKIKERATKIFLLKWEGGKVPQGAVVCGQEIAWTQHGIVNATNGNQIGTYERTVEFGGETKNEQQMLIFVR